MPTGSGASPLPAEPPGSSGGPASDRPVVRLGTGRPWPIGAHCDGEGINFAVFSAHANAIELCLFDDAGDVELARLELPGRNGDIHHGRLEGAGPGLVYGLRAHGPWRPERGHWFNPAKLLLDPYARDIVGCFEWRDEQFPSAHRELLHPDPRDNAAWALKARVVGGTADDFDWGDDTPPVIAPEQTVIYELHVKGWSRLNPGLPEALRGTYAGLAHPASTAYLKRLGVTSVELLPVHQHIDEERVAALGLVNYWGYNSIGFFCPEPRYGAAVGGQSLRDEFRAMVKALHANGIEVILDVVYNHTAEGDVDGPSISLRGLDNRSYYRHQPGGDHRVALENLTGCGNTLDLRHPRVLQLVMDSLRCWVGEMHVDGFRFDLAPALGRGDTGFDRQSGFFAAVAQDPLLSRVKLIAEPWDIGPGGYQVGGFPRGWYEWNDRFRDAMRSFWLHMGQPGAATRGEFALRLCGSSDLYEQRGRLPAESINYVVSHDGFTLLDLLSHNERHNHANGENNRDGHRRNLSFNCGAEGPGDARVQVLRSRLQRALLASTLLAQGTPMLCAGDELGHRQGGNNNPYCQDSELTWIDWSEADDDLIEFTSRLIGLRRRLLPFGNSWYTGKPDARGRIDVDWLQCDGGRLSAAGWRSADQHLLACLIHGSARQADQLLMLINAETGARAFALPRPRWQVEFDTSLLHGRVEPAKTVEGTIVLPPHSLLLLSALG